METRRRACVSDVDDSAFAKFDRMKAKVEQAEAEAAAMAELRGVEAADRRGRRGPRAESSTSQPNWRK